MAKIRNVYSFGGCIPTFLPLYDKFYVYRGNVSPLRGEKPIFGPLSKNNIGMAALRAGLPVMIQIHAQVYGIYRVINVFS